MARSSPQPRRKKRTREHVIADLGVNHVQRQVLLCGYTLEEIHRDYGLDLVMFTYNEQGESEPDMVLIQIKATDRLARGRDRMTVSFRVAQRDLMRWACETMPVILALYDAPNDVAYWLHIQGYLEEEGRPREGGQTVTLRWPLSQVFDPEAVRRIAALKAALRLRRPE